MPDRPAPARGETLPDFGSVLIGLLRQDLQRERWRAEWHRKKERAEEAPGTDALVAYAEEQLGLRLRSVPKLLDIFRSTVEKARRREIIRLAILGPRGGGKTKLAAALEVILWRFFGYDAMNLGGSFKQASICYRYVREACLGVPDLRIFTVGVPTMHLTTGRTGGKLMVAAASETSVRGEHPRGPSGAGLLAIDEVALVPDPIVDAAKGTLASADPSALIQLSTLGEKQVGRWWELIEDADHHGYDLQVFDVFDVVRRCPYDCATTCPRPVPFARDVVDEAGGIVSAAYCKGRAHEVDGHIPIDEVAKLAGEMDRATFEREFLGRQATTVGRIYDPVLLTRQSPMNVSLGGGHEHRHRMLEKRVGIDWGWDGQSCACWIARVKDKLIVYRWDFWTHTQFRRIREHVLEIAFDEHVEDVLPDGACPSDNDELREDGMRLAERRHAELGDEFAITVRPVTFSVWKTYMIGEVRRRLEGGTILFPRQYGGRDVPNWDKAMRYLRAYTADASGKPVKKDDHAPDALGCGVVGWSPRFTTQAPVAGSPRG